MTTFLFWNVQNKHLDGYIVRLVQQHKVDVLLLIEQPKPDHTLFAQLNLLGRYQRVTTHNRFGVYVNFNSSQIVRITPPAGGDRVDFWDINLNTKN